MIRTFATSTLRRTTDLSGLWRLKAGGRSTFAFVPCCTESVPGLESFRGVSVYERTVRCAGNALFSFAGVSRSAKVFLDGVLIAAHEGAYTGFSVLAPKIGEGGHTLRVEADNRFGDDSALSVPNDYMTYGGITRACVLETVGNAFLSLLRLVPQKKDGVWHLSVRVQAHSAGEAYTASLRCEIYGRAFSLGVVSVSAGGMTEAAALIPLPDALPWSPERPELTYVRCVLSVDGADADDLIERTGFREITVCGRDILLNGKRLRLLGFNRHEDHALFGCALPPAAMAEDLQIIRDLGGNAVRTSHYPNDPYFLDLCDETGILVWEEAHARGLGEERMLHPLFLPQSRACIREMIERDVSRPAVFIWGLLNECAADSVECFPIYRELTGLIRALDPSRPVTCATCRPGSGAVGEKKDPPPGFSDGDGTLPLYDVISFNCYPGWYHDTPCGEYLGGVRRWAEENGGRDKPFIVSEIGAGAVYGYRSRKGDKWSEERQAEILREQLTAVLSDRAVCGVFLWQLCDCRVSGEWFAARPRTMNNKGILDEYRRPKAAYDTVRELFLAAGRE